MEIDTLKRIFEPPQGIDDEPMGRPGNYKLVLRRVNKAAIPECSQVVQDVFQKTEAAACMAVLAAFEHGGVTLARGQKDALETMAGRAQDRLETLDTRNPFLDYIEFRVELGS
jgi:hypothetical protein